MASPLIPFASWTPAEAWLCCELARRGLVARIDGKPPRPAALAEGADLSDPFRVEHVDRDDDISLLLHIRGQHASVSLVPQVANGSRWRRDWVIELWRSPTERWTIGPGEPAAEIADASRGPLRGRLLVKRRFLLVQSDSAAFRVRLEDRAFYRHTLQSSAAPLSPERALAWSAPTQPEGAPFWQIDLGRSYFIPSLALDLAVFPPGASLWLRGNALLAPSGEMPPGSLDHSPDLARCSPGEEGLVRVEARLGWVARFVRVELRGARGEPVVLSVAGCEIHGAELLGDSLWSTWNRALAMFRDRVMFLERTGDGGYAPALRFGDVARMASGLAAHLALRLESWGPDRPRIFFALITRNRFEWIVADLAAIERRYVVVPLSPDEPDDRLADILARCRPAVMLVEHGDADRLAAVARRACPSVRLLVVCGAPASADHEARGEGPARVRFEDAAVRERARDVPPPASCDEDDLYSLLFTSGSTGAPKGAMRSYAAVNAMLATYGVPQPAFHLSFQPLSHISERMYLPAVLLHGGAVAFSRGGAFLMDELRAFEPTVLGSVPRLFELLHAAYRRRLRGGSDEEASAEARLAFGRRLMSLSVGSAPVSPEVLAFLRRVFSDIWVFEGYGTTEVGTIASDGRVNPQVRVKIVPIPGEEGRGGERGELWVRSPHTISGYLGDPDATAAALDADGFFRTGDLAERSPDGAVRVVGRLRSAVKLAQGEFVSAERVEAALGSAPAVDRIFVLVEPGASGAQALVFPDREGLAALLGAGDEPLGRLVARRDAPGVVLDALRQHGARAGLAPYELPRAVVLDAEAPSVERGLLTTSGKLARSALASHLSARLAASPRPGDDEPLARAAAAVLGRPVSMHEPLPSSLDSLGAAALLAALAAELGRAIPLSAWFASASLADLAARLSQGPTEASALEQEARRDLRRVENPVRGHVPRGSGRSSPAGGQGSARPDEPPAGGLILPVSGAHVRAPGWEPGVSSLLLTGATGFLGIHLLEALLARTPLDLVCLVRARDDGHASERLREAALRAGVEADFSRVRAVAGDLAAPLLGLSEQAFDALAGGVGGVLHAGAEVSWLAPYGALRGANVEGTRTLLRLAAPDRPLHLVSTISAAPADGDEDTTLTLEQACASSPYALSKWVSEELARRAAEGGQPVAIHRPAMIAPHSTRGVGNPEDFIGRYLAGCAELGLFLDLPGARLDMTPVDFVAGAIVALMKETPRPGARVPVHHLVNIDQSMTYAELGRALVAAGDPVAPAGYGAFRAALLGSEGERGAGLRALGAFFPEGGFGLGMGPWPSSRTRERLASLGVRCPAIDEGYVGRVRGVQRMEATKRSKR